MSMVEREAGCELLPWGAEKNQQAMPAGQVGWNATVCAPPFATLPKYLCRATHCMYSFFLVYMSRSVSQELSSERRRPHVPDPRPFPINFRSAPGVYNCTCIDQWPQERSPQQRHSYPMRQAFDRRSGASRTPRAVPAAAPAASVGRGWHPHAANGGDDRPRPRTSASRIDGSERLRWRRATRLRSRKRLFDRRRS